MMVDDTYYEKAKKEMSARLRFTTDLALLQTSKKLGREEEDIMLIHKITKTGIKPAFV